MYPVNAAIVIGKKELWDELHAAVAALPVRFVLELSEIGDQTMFLDKVSRSSPDVVFLDVGEPGTNLDAIIKAIKGTTGNPAVIALNTSAEPGIILDAMRAGASEYLFPPFGEVLNNALERISTERNKSVQSTRRGGKVIGFLSAKGGCGATTIACHVASDLPTRVANTKVLLADLDFDAGMVSFLLKSKSPYTFLDAARNTQRLDANYWRALVSNGIPGLEVISAPVPPVQQVPAGESVCYVLNFSRSNYDWIVADLGRNLTLTTLSALEQIDELYVVTTLDIPALHHAKVLIQKLFDCGYSSQRLHLVLNRTPDRFDITTEELEAMIGAKVFAVIPNFNNTLNDSYAEGHLAGHDSEPGKHFGRLSMKIAGVEAPSKKKKFSLFG